MSGNGGVQRIAGAFTDLKQQSRKALIIYLMAGDPDPAFTVDIVPKLQEAGADIVELGFPFSDPIADGPVIQAAGQRALAKLPDLVQCLEVVRNIRTACGIPLVSMTYYNPIFRYGDKKYFEDALDAGLDGVIVPDLPLVEAGDWKADAREVGIASIFLEAPNTGDEEAEKIAEASTGFVYLVSLKGVTGSDKGLGENLQSRAERMRGLTDTPAAVGFGISTPELAGRFGAMCDGVIVGSGTVSAIAEGKTAAQSEKNVVEYVRAMRAGLDAEA
ncbi:MAG: tryptophan synthase subunit alpha [SAR324 cluster bacterium]|nr:tryptophan synthase subunit alpha [SAR324 cluster bacterium]MCZ6531799.1 tryptophan synthase subunit alpha [SAR324 cluster bacterium]MCZ6627672.1 tryptophan synthase subunit alpha [SAR324 cluster bacterium]MCZ6728559.1 tryptophan synthase subunit alpha [SAR324 cluster bacterium]MCZ6842372.1 tryptophan synthase subunit alpha [SAR324 cluster bacterium]